MRLLFVDSSLVRTKSVFSTTSSPPDVARAYLQRMEIGYPPVHGSWLNRAEIEFSVLTRQALNRPFADKAAVQTAVERWKNQQNAKPKPRNWPFTTADARIKLARLHQTI